MPTYNSELFIKESIKSIQNQTYSNWELLITDDSSTDNTVLVIKNLQKADPRIKLFTLDKNRGTGYARNNSIKMAKGRYIAFCDSDDLWIENKLELQLEFIEKNKLSFSYSSYQIIDENGKLKKIRVCPEEISYWSTLINNRIGCLTVIYDRKKIGLRLMKEIRKRQDYLLWLEILKDIGGTKGIVIPLATYRVRPNSISRKKLNLLKYNYQVYRLLNYNKIISGLLLILFLFNYFTQKISNLIK